MGIQLGSATGKIVIDAGGVRQGVGEATRALGDMGKMGQSIQPLGAILAGVGAAGVLAMKSFTSQAVGFNKQAAMMEVAARSSGTAFDDLHDAAVLVGGDTRLVGVSATGAADAITGLYKAGLTTADVFGDLNGYMEDGAELGGTLRAAIDLAAASELDMAAGADAISVAMATFGLEAEDATDIADGFVQTADASVASVSDLVAAMVNVGPTAAAFGWKMEDVNVALALLSQRGIAGAEAGTALKSMMTNLMSPTDKTQEALEELNITLYDEAGVMRSLPDIAGQLSVALSGVSEEQRNQYVQTLAGTYGMKAMNTLLAEGTGGWEEMEGAIASASTAQEIAAVQAETVAGKMEALEGAWETAGITLGEFYLPALTEAIEGMTGVVEGFNAMKPAAKGATATLIGVGTAVTGVTGGFILLAPRIVTTVEALGKVGTFVGETSRAMKLLQAGIPLSQITAAGFGLQGLAAAAAAAAIPLAALIGLGVGIKATFEAHEEIVSRTSEGYVFYEEMMRRTGQSASRLSEEEWRLTGSTEAVGVATSRLADGWAGQYSPAVIRAQKLTDGWMTTLKETESGTEAAAAGMIELAGSTMEASEALMNYLEAAGEWTDMLEVHEEYLTDREELIRTAEEERTAIEAEYAGQRFATVQATEAEITTFQVEAAAAEVAARRSVEKAKTDEERAAAELRLGQLQGANAQKLAAMQGHTVMTEGITREEADKRIAAVNEGLATEMASLEEGWSQEREELRRHFAEMEVAYLEHKLTSEELSGEERAAIEGAMKAIQLQFGLVTKEAMTMTEAHETLRGAVTDLTGVEYAKMMEDWQAATEDGTISAEELRGMIEQVNDEVANRLLELFPDAANALDDTSRDAETLGRNMNDLGVEVLETTGDVGNLTEKLLEIPNRIDIDIYYNYHGSPPDVPPSGGGEEEEPVPPNVPPMQAGTLFVPRTGLAFLHRGEAVLPVADAAAYRQAVGSGYGDYRSYPVTVQVERVGDEVDIEVLAYRVAEVIARRAQ